jgi:uncharacterized membrane protein
VGTTKQIPRTSRVQVEVAAPVHAVWQVLADVTRTGEWSHECQRVTWLDGATSASYGARFRGDNLWLAFRWSRTNEIIELEPEHVIAWRTVPSWRFPDSTEWRFTLEASTLGTRITQTYELVHAPAWWAWLMARMVPPHRDRSAALAADLRRIGDVARPA